MDYRTDRFDQFGFETPFTPSGATAIAEDYAGQGEQLAWLDTEDEDFEAELFEDEWDGAAPSQSLLGGQLWSGTDASSGTRHAIFVTPMALEAEQAEVLFYVHGLLAPCGGLPKAGVAAFISEAQFALGATVVGSGRPIVLIVPQFQEADDRRWQTRGLDKPAALNAYIDRRMAEIATITGRAAQQISGLIVAGHSRGYGILNPLVAAHRHPALAQGALARLTGLWFLDSSYGGFPSANAAALLKAKPALSVRQVYIAGSRTDVLGGRSRQGRLAYMPVSARKARHCAIPAKCLPDLLADRPLSIAPNPPARREAFADEQDFGSDDDDYAAFALDDEEAGWSEAEGKDFDGADEDYSFGAGEDLADISAQDEFENFLDEGGTGTAGIQRDYSLKDLASGKLGAIPENLRDDILAGRQRDANAVANRIVAIKHPSLANQRLDPANRNHAKAIRDWSRASRDASALIWLTRIVAILDAHRGTLPRAFLLGWMAKESDGSVKPVTHLQERGYFQVHPAEAKDHLKLEGAAFEALTTDRTASIREGIRLVQVHRSHLAKSYGIADPSELLLQLTKARHGLPGALKKAITTIRATGMPLSWIWVAAFMSASKIGRRVVQNVDDTLDYAAQLKQLSDKIPVRTVANPEAFDESGTNWEDEVQSEWLDEYEFEEEEEGGESASFAEALGSESDVSGWTPRGPAPLPRPSDNPIPFAPLPPAGSFWPVKTNHESKKLVSYDYNQNGKRGTNGRSGRKFLADRKTKGSKTSNRYHVGIDLFARRNDPVHACEKGEIVGFGFFYKARSGQYTYKLLVHHPESAIVANYGEVTPDSLKRTGLNVGSQVEAGQVIGYVSDTDMLHFETYKPAASKEGSSATARWMKSEKRPARLLNPTRYLLFLSENGRDP